MSSSYLAFISYRRFHGSRIARWLRNHLKQYKLPQEVLSSLSDANREMHKSRLRLGEERISPLARVNVGSSTIYDVSPVISGI